MLEVDHVRHSYGPDVLAIDDVSMEVRSGEIVALLGVNGAGKSTLAALVAGLRRPDVGAVRIAGIDLARDPIRARRHLGFVPQDLGLYPLVTVEENLRYFAELAGHSRRAAQARAHVVADQLDLTALLGRRARALSGGEKRRLHVALGLLHEPTLLVLDEPTAGVDVHTRARLLATVRDMAEAGAAVCYMTHYLTEVEQLDARVVILDAGRVIAEGTIPELVARSGGGVVVFTFEGPAPSLTAIEGAVTTGNELRLATTAPADAIGRVVRAADAAGAPLRAIEIVERSLESLFVELTGRRFATDPTEAPTLEGAR